MVDIFRYSEISEANARILNPLSESKFLQLGQICRLDPSQRQLDLACGKGEMLCHFARAHGITGVGIDIHPPFLAEARARAAQLGVEDRVVFQEGDAGRYQHHGEGFDVVSCIGATWIGGGLAGTLELMGRAAAPGAWFLVGEVFWIEEPPAAIRATRETLQDFADLGGTLGRIEAAGLELVEMVIASPDDWDRYQARQWLAVADWAAAHPDHPEVGEVRRMCDEWRRSYLAHERRCMGWGVFVLKDRW